MSDAFYIAHSTDGRTRIRWAGDVSEKARIKEVAENIAAIQGVDQALPRLTTGSIIIEHEQVEWSSLEPQITDKLSLVFIAPAPVQPHPGLASINQGLEKVDETFKGMNTDLGSVTVLLLIILSITQALRGQVMGNSMSFLWYAISIATKARYTSAAPLDSERDITE